MGDQVAEFVIITSLDHSTASLQENNHADFDVEKGSIQSNFLLENILNKIKDLTEEVRNVKN